MKINQTYKSVFILLLIVGSFFFISKTIAVSSPYRAGETRDPACAPGDLFCTVNLDKDLYKENALGAVTNVTSGTNSIVIGSGSTASGDYSIAVGHEDPNTLEPGPTASGDFSVAIGNATQSTGNFSVAIGGGTASGASSLSMGHLSLSSGNESIAIGPGTIAASFREISLGSYPTDHSPSSESWSGTDRLLNVGNGSSSVARSDAFTILKNGKIGIGTNRPGWSFDISSKTDALALPRGTDADRPISLAEGLLRFNMTGEHLEYSDGETWIPLTSSSSLKLITENYINTADLPNPDGNESVSIGVGTKTTTYGEVSLGMYPRISLGSKTLVDTADVLFTVGNGTSEVARSNAFIINKGGTIGLGDVTKADLTSAEASNAFMTTETGGYLKLDGTWVSASDRSLKTNIKDISYGLETIEKIQPRSFEYIKTGEPSIGFIAQEMETVVPEIVSDGGMGTKGISYGQLTAVLVKAVQELSDRVEDLESDAGITPAKVEQVEEVPAEEVPAPVEETPAKETPAETLPASLIASSNEINLTNILLMLAIGLLLINLAVQVKKNN